MKVKFNFDIGNRGLLQEELGLAELVNASLRNSAHKHGIVLKVGSLVTVKIIDRPNGRMVRQVSAENKDPERVPLAAA